MTSAQMLEVGSQAVAQLASEVRELRQLLEERLPDRSTWERLLRILEEGGQDE